MKGMLNRLGSVTGLLGLLVCLLAGTSRLAGHSYLLGFETLTLFIGGIALLTTACFIKLEAAACQCE